MFKYKISEEISSFLEDAKIEEISIGCSNSQVFKITKADGIYFLKIAEEGLLTREYTALKWLKGKLNVPQIVIYNLINGVEALITESLPGEMVCSDDILKNPKIDSKKFWKRICRKTI